VNEAEKARKPKIGVLYCAEAPVCAGLPPVLQKIASNVVGGVSVVYSNKISATEPNYAAVCLAAKAAGVQALYVAQNAPTVVRVADQCAQQGFRPKLLGTVGTIDAAPSDPNFNGALSTLSNAPLTNRSAPAMRAFHAALRAYAGSLVGSAQYNNTLTSPWAGGELFVAAAKKARLGPRSRPADVVRGLRALRNATLRGIAPPLTLKTRTPALVRCYFVQTIRNGRLAEPYGARPQCIPKPKVTAVLRALQG
jgi:branched-chain amino acid transport system substrate-binding protein